MSLECVVCIVQRQTLTQMALRNLSKKFDLLGKLFRKQILRGVVDLL